MQLVPCGIDSSQSLYLGPFALHLLLAFVRHADLYPPHCSLRALIDLIFPASTASALPGLNCCFPLHSWLGCWVGCPLLHHQGSASFPSTWLRSRMATGSVSNSAAVRTEMLHLSQTGFGGLLNLRCYISAYICHPPVSPFWRR